MPDSRQQLTAIFHSAIALDSRERRSYLDAACAGDAGLRREVEALIESHDSAGSFIESPAYERGAELLAGDGAASLSGHAIGPYKIVSLLGAGGMGEVYLAQDMRLERNVALKILPASVAQNQERMQRFVREAKAASSLNHPNIVTIHEIGVNDQTHYIATEYIEGETLRARLTGSPVTLKSALEIAVQVASALDAAHRAGIVHRDVKPENVMVRPDGLVKLLDFGIAKLTGPQSAVNSEAATAIKAQTTPGMIIGTAAYMSPEQARGKEVDARTDIFSLGVMLYEMLAGKPPFDGENALETIGAILNQEPAPLSEHLPDAPREIERIVNKALRKDRDERYQTAKDFLLDLKDAQRDLEFQDKLERTAAPQREEAQPTALAAATSADRHTTSSAEYVVSEIKQHKRAVVIGLTLVLLTAIGVGYWLFAHRSATATQIESIAVLPFVNESGNADNEYLSDGMTESLINNLSELPHLSVKARSTVFRYKGKEVEPQRIAAELNVQAILSGRLVQRGDALTLYLSLVDARNGNQLWGEQYNRKLTDLIALQSEIARDVSQKLRTRLSGVDEQKVLKNYTANAEAYQLYLKGRYHVFKLTTPEVQKGIQYFQQAIELDPTYALAYVGLSEAYRSFALAGEMTPADSLPKAKAAAQKAIDLDDAFAEAHTALGISIFWYDWRWDEAERQYKRALELNPNNADTHLFYAHVLSNTGRHAEALAEIKRARELDPLSPFVNAQEGQFLLHAGRIDEALDRLQKTFELAPQFWLPHVFAVGAYIEKRMYAEAIAEARRAKELSPMQTVSDAFAGYALAKSGKRDEARAVLEGLLKLSRERFVPPYHIALIYNALDERAETLAWLERGIEQRDPKMAFLKVEPKWNNLRADPRFQDLLRRVGFTT